MAKTYEEMLDELDQGTEDLLRDPMAKAKVYAARNAVYDLRRTAQRFAGTKKGTVLQSLRVVLALAELHDCGYKVQARDEA